MDRLANIQAKLRHMNCPRCGYTGLYAHLHLGEGQEPARHYAHCSHCGFSFEVDEHTPTWEVVEEHLQHRARIAGCPRCKSARINLNYRCNTESKQCFHVASCQNCGAVFVLEQPLEGEKKPPILDR